MHPPPTMFLPPKPTRRRPHLVFMPEGAAVWAFMARFIRAQIKVENVWRANHRMRFCHMPVSQGEYLTEPIDVGRS